MVVPSFSADTQTVYKVPIYEEVEDGLYAFLKRSIKEAEEAEADAIIFDINTPGGFVDSAEKIVNLLDSTPIRKIAYINSQALSAGAYLALHTDEIYMSPNGSMGAAAVIDSAGNAADMKATSAWKAKMRNAAERTGKEPIYAQAMADESVDLPEYRAGEGQLLTLSAREAIEVGYSEGTVATFDELLKKSNLTGAKVVETKEAFVETLARIVTNPVVVPILLSLASLGLILELYSPGFGVPGTVGLLSLGLFFYGHLVAGLAGYETFVLLALGILLVIAEFFIPGGIIGILGLVAILFSIILAGGNLFYMSVAVLIAITVAIIGMVIIVKFFGKKVRLLNKMILTDATTTEKGYVSNHNRLDLVGKIAETMTPLRPSGTIRIENERIDAVSDGSFIGKDKQVVIIKVEGSRIVVREAREGEATQ
ncbi:nodulation protein NfeD [Psychrobacillus sp. FSL K6-2684]|uniref:Nodulation protein NfeD n=1 Tax=Psychrobacillus faecigallinarum TaxID=2762235 RepID=A0ABR8R7R4_9BACI|nr:MULTISPECIES: nodulation protein NfeD [Psychrobacillus]MBD7943833.1 nodulation protein NfeD [Psychrobacillus faecigallinarum]QEY22851.1 nodulation protein NfeD [Psychrobacillus sp. AK 1817]